MEITEIIEQLKGKFGNTFDVAKVTEKLGSMKDHTKMSFTEIVEKLKGHNLIGDLDGDGKVESPLEEIKGKAASVFGGIFHRK